MSPVVPVASASLKSPFWTNKRPDPQHVPLSFRLPPLSYAPRIPPEVTHPPGPSASAAPSVTPKKHRNIVDPSVAPSFHSPSLIGGSSKDASAVSVSSKSGVATISSE
jgi:hypothetical protein